MASLAQVLKPAMLTASNGTITVAVCSPDGSSISSMQSLTLTVPHEDIDDMLSQAIIESSAVPGQPALKVGQP